jgi:putative transposase
MCALRRSKHSVYDLKYHFVWIPKYRKKILTPEVIEYAKEVFQRIAEEYDMMIDTLEVVEDHVHIFLQAVHRPPGILCISKMVVL